MALTWQDLGGNARATRYFLNVWPPFLFSSIRVEEISEDFRYARVRLRRRFWTRNYVGTLFGGSLFAMTDPFWMLLIYRCLGSADYVVWDAAGEIRFRSPGRADVIAEFRVSDELLDELRTAAADGQKVLRWVSTDIVTKEGTLIATVRKQIYVRRRS